MRKTFRKHEESVTEYGSRLMCEATLGKMNIGMFVCKDLSGSANVRIFVFNNFSIKCDNVLHKI